MELHLNNERHIERYHSADDLPTEPLTTRPSSVHTAAHLTSVSWPVRMALGVAVSPEIKKIKTQVTH